MSFISLFDDGIVDSSHLISEKYELITEINSMHAVYVSFPQIVFKSIWFNHLLNKSAHFSPFFVDFPILTTESNGINFKIIESLSTDCDNPCLTK